MKFSNNDGQNHIRNNTVYITCMFRSHRYGVALVWRIGFSKEEKNEKSEKSLLFHLQKRKISNYWSQVYVIHFQERICREKIVSHEHLTYRVVKKEGWESEYLHFPKVFLRNELFDVHVWKCDTKDYDKRNSSLFHFPFEIIQCWVKYNWSTYSK